MKKIFTLLICVFSLHSFSQNISFFGGVGGSWVFGGESWGNRIGVLLGADASVYELNENSIITAGLAFSMQGASYDEGDYSGSVNTSYLSVPILFNYVSEGGFYGEAGLQPGFLLTAKDKYDGMSYDYKDSMQKFELGIPVGAGYRINENIRIGARAIIGLINIDNDSSESSDHNFMLLAIIRYTL